MTEIETIIAQTLEILQTWEIPKTPPDRRAVIMSQQVWAPTVLRKHGRKCARCGSRENVQAHHMHRIADAPHLAMNPDNGIALCRECHQYAHRTGQYCAPGTPLYMGHEGVQTDTRKQPQLPF